MENFDDGPGKSSQNEYLEAKKISNKSLPSPNDISKLIDRMPKQ